jgi:hypothetical protein
MCYTYSYSLVFPMKHSALLDILSSSQKTKVEAQAHVKAHMRVRHKHTLRHSFALSTKALGTGTKALACVHIQAGRNRSIISQLMMCLRLLKILCLRLLKVGLLKTSGCRQLKYYLNFPVLDKKSSTFGTQIDRAERK